jgi:hypothetical protein
MVGATGDEVAAARAPGAPDLDPARGRVAHLIAWSWAAGGSNLVERYADPLAVVPFVEPSAHQFYWELHFQGARLASTDFIHRAALSPGGRNGAAAAPDPILETLRDWYAGEGAGLCHASTWLEIDGPLDGATRARRQGVSICVDPQFCTPAAGDPAFTQRPAADMQSLLASLQAACGGGEPSDRPTLGRVRDATVACGGFMRHLSVMRSRPDRPCKLYVTVPKAALPRFLAAIDWEGDSRAVCDLAETACSSSTHANLDLEIRRGRIPRVGMELISDPAPPEDPLRQVALDYALARALLTPAQAQALQRWVQPFRIVLGNDLWPTRGRRWLDLKFVVHAQRPLELKAYLGFRTHNGIF